MKIFFDLNFILIVTAEMDFDNLLIGAIISIGTALVSLIDKWKKKTTSNFKRINIIATILFVLGALGVFLTYNSGRKSKIDKVASDSAAARKDRQYQIVNEELKQSQKQLITLSLHQMDTSKKILQYSQNLNVKQNDLINRQDQFQKDVFGQGYCWLGFVGNSDGTVYSGYIKNFDKTYPVNDITILFIFQDSLLKCKPTISGDSIYLPRDCYYQHSISTVKDVVSAGGLTYVDLALGSELKGKIMLFEARIASKGGQFLQQTAMLFDRGWCAQYSKMFKVKNGIFELLSVRNELNVAFDWNKYFFNPNNRTFLF